jgi:hypothetical protein
LARCKCAGAIENRLKVVDWSSSFANPAGQGAVIIRGGAMAAINPARIEAGFSMARGDPGNGHDNDARRWAGGVGIATC